MSYTNSLYNISLQNDYTTLPLFQDPTLLGENYALLLNAIIVQWPSRVWLLVIPWTAARLASLSLTIPEVCPSSGPLHVESLQL